MADYKQKAKALKATRNYNMKRAKLNAKLNKQKMDAKSSNAVQLTRAIGNEANKMAATIVTNRTVRHQASANKDKEIAAYNSRSIEESLKAYNDAISGNPSMGSSGSTQKGSTTELDSYGSRY